MSQRPVTRGDIEAKLGEIQDSLTTQAEQARSNQDHQCSGDFADDQEAANPLARTGTAVTAGAGG